MVGVPGKVRGCKTCRRRKKKCTLERPICERCKKGGFVCGGYDVERVFVNSTTTANGVISVRVAPEIEYRQSLNLSAYAENYLGLFFNIYLPNGTNLGGQFPTGSWLTVAKDLSCQNGSVRKALLAVCLILIGQRDKHQWMIIESLKLYTSALDELRSSLSAPSTMTDDAMLVASRALATYELLGSVDANNSADTRRPQSWHSHNQGQVAIMTRRGPENYMHGQAHRLFADGRVQLVIAACVNNRRCFLSEPEWLNVPWTYQTKTPRDLLVDVVAHGPSLLEDVNILTSQNVSEDDSVALRIRDTYAHLFHGLNAWEAAHFPAQELMELRSRCSKGSPTPTDILVTHIVTMFWNTCLVVHNTMRVAYTMSDAIDPDPAWVQAWSKPALDEYCTNIADVIGILLHPDSGYFWAQYAIFPVACSLRYLTTTGQLKSEAADKILNVFTGQMDRDALITFVLGAVKAWPGFGSWHCVSTSREWDEFSPTV